MSVKAPMLVRPDCRPVLPRFVKLKFDKTRGLWLLLAPERILVPDPTSVEVLELCDGQRSVADIVGVLADKYDAPCDQILTDVVAMLEDLAEKGFLADAGEGAP